MPRVDRELLMINPRPLIGPEINLGLIWSAKSGCTYGVKWFFYQLGILEEALNYHSWVHHFRDRVYYLRQDKYPSSSWNNSDFTWVRLVRSPMDRAVSSYIHAVKYQYENEFISSFLGRKIDSENGFSFREFLKYLSSIDLERANIHHRIQYHPVEGDLNSRNMELIKLEAAREYFEELEVKLHLRSSKGLDFRKSSHNSERFSTRISVSDKRFTCMDLKFPDCSFFYDSDLEEIVRNLYQCDFDNYGY